MHTVHSLVKWFCAQLTLKELFEAIALLLEVAGGRRTDIELDSTFREDHPNYRHFEVDTEPPLTEPPETVPRTATLDWEKELLRYEIEKGRKLKPVNRQNGQSPPANSHCERCGAPAEWLYVNDGIKCSQLRCKICSLFFPVRRIRHQASGPFWCPYCGNALFEWKHNDYRTIYKCPNRKCPHYQQAYNKLNLKEKALVKTGMSSQFKLHYQWRSYHFDPASIRPRAPREACMSLLNVRKGLESVGLALAYSVTLGLSARMTSQVLRDIHGITASHQTVLNWMEAAAPLAWRTLQKQMKGTMTEAGAAVDETYIKIRGIWHYTWLIIGMETRAIWAWNVSETRSEIPATAVINQALDSRDPDVTGTLVLVGDGNPSYDAATNAVNTDSEGLPLSSDQRKVERRTVIGLRNDDEQSAQFRVFKQIIERVNRTYRYHTRSRSGHKSMNGAVALTTLFVASYNFLRPHKTLGYVPPVHLSELDDVKTLQGKWLKLLQMAS
jgi:transposase-like protein